MYALEICENTNQYLILFLLLLLLLLFSIYIYIYIENAINTGKKVRRQCFSTNGRLFLNNILTYSDITGHDHDLGWY